MFANILLMALRAIRRNLLRSCLTVLGIVIGVASVIVIVTLGAGTNAQVQNEITKMGSNMVTLSPGGDRRGPGGTAGSAASKFSNGMVNNARPASTLAATRNR